MDIGLIAGKVKENTRGDSFILSDGTVGIPHMMLLFLGYLKGKASLELEGEPFRTVRTVLWNWCF